MKVRMTAFLAVAAVLAALSVPTKADAPFSRIVVFGTSLSDSGNAFALRGGTNVPPDYDMDPLLVPRVPYARGGHHFSNGATWIEQFARSRGLAGSARPALASEGRGSNYAVGAARAWEDGLNFNLSAQVEEFIQEFGHVAPSDALYAIEMGGNDIRDAFVVYAGGGNGAPVLQEAIQGIAGNIQRLYAAGARNFLVWRAPNVGLTPALQKLGPQAAGLATFLTVQFNNGLDGAVAQLSALPGINIARLDGFTLINDIASAPEQYGLTNAIAPCVTPNIAPFHCDRPDDYLFWDGIHPTAAAHGIVAQRAAQALQQ